MVKYLILFRLTSKLPMKRFKLLLAINSVQAERGMIHKGKERPTGFCISNTFHPASPTGLDKRTKTTI